MTFISDQLPISVATTAELVQVKTRDNGIIQTAGYSTPGDDGGGRYISHLQGRAALEALGIVMDQGFYFAGPGDGYCELADKKLANVRQFGAVGGRNADATDAFNRAALAAINIRYTSSVEKNQIAVFSIPSGHYRIRYGCFDAPSVIEGRGRNSDRAVISAWENAGTCDFTVSGSTFTTSRFPWVNGQPITFVGESLPGGIVANKTYYVMNSSFTAYQINTTTTFQVTESIDYTSAKYGNPVTLTSDGSGLAVHGRFLTDTGNAAKLCINNLVLFGNLWDSSGDTLATTDEDYQSPHVLEVLSLGPTPAKGESGVLWGTGAELDAIKILSFQNAVGVEADQNISKANLVWPERCGQSFRIRGNGFGVTGCYASGNRGVAFQYNRSKSFEVDYSTSTSRIFTDEVIPRNSSIVYFLGDDLPSGLTAQKPYYVRNTDIFMAFTVNYGTSTTVITNASHGLAEGIRLYFTGSSGSTLPSGLTKDTKYFVKYIDASTFEVSLTLGGAAVDLGSNATGTVYYYLRSFAVAETSGGTIIDLGDNGSGDMRYSIYSTSAIDIHGATTQVDIEVEAPFAFDAITINSSETLQSNFLGVYISLNNAGSNFSATGSNDTFTLGTAISGFNGATLSDGLEVYLAGSALPTGALENRRYWVRDLSGSTFKLAETEGGAAIDITADGSGTIAITPIPTNIVRWLQFAGAMHGPRVSPGARGYSNFALIAESTPKEASIAQPDGFQLSTTRYLGKLFASGFNFPEKDGYAVIVGSSNITMSARVKLNDWMAVFNGTDRKITLNNTIAMTKAAEYSIAFKCSVRTLGRVLASHTVSQNSFLANFFGANEWRYRGYNSGVGSPYLSITLPNACNDGAMHTYLLVRAPGNVFAVYQDGIECVTAIVGTLLENFGWFDLIGRQGADVSPSWFDGDLEYLTAWDRTFDAGEIADAATEVFPDAPLFNMPFIDAAGDTVTDVGYGNLVGSYSGTGSLFAPVGLPSLTAENSGTVDSGDATTDAVIESLRTRIAEIEDALQDLGYLQS